MKEIKGLKILFVSAEVEPFAKTGGLADVAGSLTKELAAMGNDVRVAMPAYKSIKSSMDYVEDFPVYINHREETCIVRETEINFKRYGSNKNLPVYFIDNYHYYNRDSIYCHMDDGERFVFLCKAVLEMLPKINFQPDIIHCNDWHTGPICMLLNEVYREKEFYKDISTVFTVHNLEYQGNFPGEVFRLFNVDESIFTPEKTEFYGAFSFMKSGLVYADIINTVSKMYAEEIVTPRYGEKLEGVLKDREKDLFGIVNGISYEQFDPENDIELFKNFNADNVELKYDNKKKLQQEMGLPVRDVPVVSIISRLAGQKGFDLIIEEIDSIMERDIQFVLLGTGDPYYEEAFKKIRERYPEKVGLFFGFNSPLAKRIYAGSDIFLMPSRFEPCGLGQMISLRYGTIPVVRRTGGLAETIVDYNNDRFNGNGFMFNEYSSSEMIYAIERALNLYSMEPEKWRQLVKRALQLDYSWKKPGHEYINIYYLAMEKRHRRGRV